MNDFLTWQTLATFAGCSAAVAALTQFLKNAGAIKKVPTQWVSYGLAVILMLGATYFTGALTGPVAALIPFNAVVVSLAANGAYAAIQRVSAPTADRNATEPQKATEVKLDAEPAKPAEMATQPSETASAASTDDKDKTVIG